MPGCKNLHSDVTYCNCNGYHPPVCTEDAENDHVNIPPIMEWYMPQNIHCGQNCIILEYST
jgi:hypothetical protein